MEGPVYGIVLLTAVLGFLSTSVAGFIMIYKEVKGTRHDINSRMDQLLESARKLAKAEGVKEGMESRSESDRADQAAATEIDLARAEGLEEGRESPTAGG